MKIPLTPVRFLYRAIDLYGTETGVVCGDHRHTYSEFGARCERLAAGLAAEGVRSGDRVAYLSLNNRQLLEGYYGVPLSRAILTPLNVRLTTTELVEILNHCEPCMLIFEREFAAHVETFRKSCPAIERYVSIDGVVPQADFTYEELLSKGRSERPDFFSFDEDAIAELFYTSGSTGSPKGVMLGHRTLYLHALSVLPFYNVRDTGVELHTIPLFHANGWGRPHTSTMNGLKQVLVRRFDPENVLRLIQEER
ncbi:MAG: AMP-binding protein, partial [Acidobacteriota bacterium]|nr:AMP-binding protein [Acidobacteriota bacterium]